LFNTEPLLNELNNIIKERLEDMLQEFLFKYRLFEENYNAVLNLPAFKHNMGTYKSFNVKKSSSNKKKKSPKKISLIKNLLEKNKLLQEEINKLKGVNIIDLTSDTDSDDNTNVHVVVIKEEPITVRLEKENIRLNIEEDSSVEEDSSIEGNNDNICCDCECRVILDSDITVVDGKKYCGVCVPEPDEEESDKEEEEESDKEEVEESDKEESDKEEEEEEETVASSVAGLEEEEEEDVDTEASDEESVDETSNDLATKKEEAIVEAVASVEEEDEELFEIEIDDQTYCTNNEVNGFIYILDKDGDVGDKIGYFKDSEPIFYNEEN
jgi:hypothetical protein